MIPPKYNFYIGQAIQVGINKHMVITESGEFDDADDHVSDGFEKYASHMIELQKDSLLFLNLVFAESYSSVFFYENMYTSSFISSTKLSDYNDKTITPPNGAKYCAIRFTEENRDFTKRKSDDAFIYVVEQIEPHFSSLSKKYAKESGQEFFRVSLDGKINLFGDAYEAVNQSNIDDRLIFIITKYNATKDEWFAYYKGGFNKTDCKIDKEKKKCELKTTVIDEYATILDKYEDTYDLTKISTGLSSVLLHKRAVIQFYVLGSKVITNAIGGTYWETDIDEVIDDSNIARKYGFGTLDGHSHAEIYVEDSIIPEVNGVYRADVSKNQRFYLSNVGNCVGRFTNSYGYTITAYTTTEESGMQGPIEWYYYVLLDRNNNVISHLASRYLDRDYGYDEIYNIFDTGTFPIPSISGTYCIITGCVVNRVFTRFLCDRDVAYNGELRLVAVDDPARGSLNYTHTGIVNIGNIVFSAETVDTPTKYGINDNGQYFTPGLSSIVIGTNAIIPVCKYMWTNIAIWYVYPDILEYQKFDENTRRIYELKDCYYIAAAIKALIKKIDPTLDHEGTAAYSEFLYGDSIPLKDMQAYEKFYLFIAQKTNVLKGNYDQPAQKAETTLKELMEMLRSCFRCYWFIEDGKFRIEHISYFMNGRSYSDEHKFQLDFTELKDQFNKKQSAYFQSEIEYDKQDLPRRYEFSWMEDATELFDGASIDVKANYVQADKTEEISANNFSADVDYMLIDPSNFSNDGFALLGTYLDEYYGHPSQIVAIRKIETIDENRRRYDTLAQNSFMTWAYLQKFYMYDMPATAIESNTSDGLQVQSVKSCMSHSIIVPCEEDLNTFELIKTEFGDGKIDEVSIDMNTRHAKIKLVYKPE